MTNLDDGIITERELVGIDVELLEELGVTFEKRQAGIYEPGYHNCPLVKSILITYFHCLMGFQHTISKWSCRLVTSEEASVYRDKLSNRRQNCKSLALIPVNRGIFQYQQPSHDKTTHGSTFHRDGL